MLSTTSSSTSASTSISDPEPRSALLGLVDVGLLADARVGVLGLGLAVDPAVPPDRPALPLLVLEGRLLRLQLVDERGNVGLVGLPEPGHGGRRGERRESKRPGTAGPAVRVRLRLRPDAGAGRRAGS